MINWIITGIIVFVIIVLGAICASGYLKAPPDEAFIISGLKKNPKVLIGKAGIKIPFLERKDTLLLKQMSVDIKTNGYVPTLDFIGVDVDAVAKIAIKRDDAGMNIAMQNFLNMTEDEIVSCLTDSLQGNMREIVGTITLKNLVNDRTKFGDEVQTKAQKDMDRLGIEIISCNIQRLDDEKGLINALGQDNMSQIQKDASIAKANANRDVAIAEAQATKIANDAKAEAAEAIAERNAIVSKKKADLKKEVDIKEAQAEAAASIENENQRKARDVAATDANIAKAEREAELKKKQIELRERELDALVRKQADADKYAAEKAAEADLIRRKKDAEAKAYQIKQEAEAQKAKADADKYSAEMQAAGIRAVGEAEAAAIEKKAEAQRKMGEASVLEMYINKLPQIVASAAGPLEKVDKITLYGEGNEARLVGDIMKTTDKVVNGIKDVTGIDIAQLIGTVVANKTEK